MIPDRLSDCQGGGDRFLLAPGSPCGHRGLALLRRHRGVQALNESVSYREAEAAGADALGGFIHPLV